MRFRRLYPFLIVLAIEFFFMLYLVVGHRGVIGHDTFAYFSLQYYFLNNAANSGETVQWMPLITHGFVSNWWYAPQAGILQRALLGLGGLNAIFLESNFLPIFYLGILFDLAIFTLGVYLLGLRYFSSRLANLFVCITTVASAAWFTQFSWDLHFCFCLPLIFHFIHTFFETGRWRYFLLAGNLFAVQWLGSPAYFAPFTALVVTSYTFFYLVFFREKTGKEIRRLLKSWALGIVPVVCVLLSLFFVYETLTYGTEDLVVYEAGRGRDRRNVSLDSFLTYGTNSNFRWAEVVTRVSPALDYGLYFGYLALAFAGIAVFTRRNRAVLMVACTTLVVFLVSVATPLATLFYYTWPGMQYFRHLSLASTIVRMLLCFLAGFGFEAILTPSPNEEFRYTSKVRMSILLLFAAAAGLLKFSYQYRYAMALLSLSVYGSLPLDEGVFSSAYLPHELVKASFWCFGAVAFFLVLLMGKVPRKNLAIAAIIFQALDIYSFKMDLSHRRTVQLTPGQYDITRLQAVPYSARRQSVDFRTHPRAKNVPQNDYPYGETYWTVDLLAFLDQPSSSGRTDHWPLPLDDFLRTYSGETIRAMGRTSAYRQDQSFAFPFQEPNALKLAGVTEDKIQFFSRAHFVETDQRISEMMASKNFNGDILLLSGASDGEEAVSLVANERTQRDYDVVQYDANNIKILVKGAAQGDWLYYADCWHPFWSGTVNGKNSVISKANLAYKAVQLEQGDNVVHFRFHSSRLAFFMGVIEWNAVIWVFLPLFLLWRESLESNRRVLGEV
jgi:hypothetical protein